MVDSSDEIMLEKECKASKSTPHSHTLAHEALLEFISGSEKTRPFLPDGWLYFFMLLMEVDVGTGVYK